jgi:hypothetical protein
MAIPKNRAISQTLAESTNLFFSPMSIILFRHLEKFKTKKFILDNAGGTGTSGGRKEVSLFVCFPLIQNKTTSLLVFLNYSPPMNLP